MEIDLLLLLAQRGIPGVLKVSCLDMREGGHCANFLPELINHARVTGLVQLLVCTEEHRELQLDLLKRRLDALALEHEVFTVDEPVCVEERVYRIDVHRNGEGSAFKAVRDSVSGELPDEVLLQRTIDLFDASGTRGDERRELTRLCNILFNGKIYYLWQMAMLHGPGSLQPQRFGKKAWKCVQDKLHEHGCEGGMVFSPEQQQRLEQRSPAYRWRAP